RHRGGADRRRDNAQALRGRSWPAVSESGKLTLSESHSRPRTKNPRRDGFARPQTRASKETLIWRAPRCRRLHFASKVFTWTYPNLCHDFTVAPGNVVDLRKLLAERFPHPATPATSLLTTGLSFLDQTIGGGLP